MVILIFFFQMHFLPSFGQMNRRTTKTAPATVLIAPKILRKLTNFPKNGSTFVKNHSCLEASIRK